MVMATVPGPSQTAGRLDPETAYVRIREVIGCKWSLAIFDAIAAGCNRPGQMLRANEGLTQRVLHRCLQRLSHDGLLGRNVVAETPLHVEYHLTDVGSQLFDVIKQLRWMAMEWRGDQPPLFPERNEP